MKPLVSIIIPVYNSEKHLAECIESAIAQTWANKEVIIVDDGSTDGSLKIAQKYRDIPGLSIISQENQGASAARNTGLKAAKGDYIQFLDADDLLKDNKMELQINALSNSPDTVAFGGFINFFDGNDKDAQPAESYLRSDYPSGEALLFDLYGGNTKTFAGGMVPQHCWLTPKSVIDRAGGWDTGLTVDDDGEFFCRVVLKSNGIKYVEDAICYYRRHAHQNNLSAQKAYRSFQSTFDAIKLKCGHIGNLKKINALLANQAMQLLVNVYPEYPELCKQIEQFINQVGGNTWAPYQEGMHKYFRVVFGWKIVKRLSHYKNQ